MTIQEFYDWAKDNNLLDSRLMTEIVERGNKGYLCHYYEKPNIAVHTYTKKEDKLIKDSFEGIEDWDGYSNLKNGEKFICLEKEER